MKSIPDEYTTINLRLLKYHKLQLKELAKRKGLSISAYIRMIIIDEIEIISRKDLKNK